MFKTDQFHAKAAQYCKLSKKTTSPAEANEFRELGRELINSYRNGLPEPALELKAAVTRGRRYFRDVPILLKKDFQGLIEQY